MHRPSWLRRSKKPEAKAATTTSSNSTSSASLLVTSAGPGPSDTSNIPQNNCQSRGSLWDKAYEDLQNDEKNLVDVFEKLLLSEPEIQTTSTLANGDPSIREKQMSALVAKKLETMKEAQWKLQMGEKSIEVRQQVDRIVKVVEVAKVFITSAANMDPIHAGLPWAGVCMLLPLITKDSEQRTAATDGLEYISGLIRRYTQVEQIYLGDDNFPLKGDLQSSITKLYRHVLEYEARAACQFNRNTAYQWVRNVVEADSWKNIIGTIKDLEAGCDKLTWIIDAKDQRIRTSRLEFYLERQNHDVRELLRVSHVQEEEQGKLHVAESKAGRKEQNDWHRSEEEFACYECLRTTDYETNKNRNPVRIPGTCEWFLRHPRYKKWLDEQRSTWLWVTADPGCGKSVLSRFLVDEYKKGALPDTNTICYYFFKDNSEEGRSATHALSAILHQLFSQNNRLLRHAIPEYRRNGSKLPGLFNELWSIFISAAADPDAGSLVCILDALDECAVSTRLPLMRKLANFCLNPELGTRLKFIIVSRPYASISDTFWEENPNVASVQLMGESEAEMEAIRVEIDLVIEEKVNQFNRRRLHKGVDDDTHIAVQEKLRSIENRTYLWVALIFPELEKKAGLAKSKLLQLIRNIPKSVDEAYERILNKSSDREQARKLLHIVVAAKRPLNLTEMNIALSMKEGASSMEDLELEPESSFQTTVRNLCGLFVAIRDSTIYLIHQTAKEFLVARNTTSDPASTVPGLDSWRHSLEPAKSNHILAMICISYLSLDAFECDPLVLEEEDNINKEEKRAGKEMDGKEDERSEYNSNGSEYDPSLEYEEVRNLIDNYVVMHPFFEYAACNWPMHLREAESLDDSATLKAAFMICASHPNRLQTWFPVYQERMALGHRAKDITDLMIGSYLGLEGMVKSCLAQGAEKNAKDTVLGWTPLVFAAYKGHRAIVKILLEDDADPNIQDRRSKTALHHAVSMDHETIVKMLLESNADPNIQDMQPRTALMDAVRHGLETIVKMLLESNADPNIHDMQRRTALMDAVHHGPETIVKMLLESKADPNEQTEKGETALMIAVYYENESIVKRLLESSAVPDTQTEKGETALMRAVTNSGNETIVKILLEHGAKSKIRDNVGETALMMARGLIVAWNSLLEQVAEPIEREWLLARRNSSQASLDILLEYETEPAETSTDNDEWSTTSSTDTPAQSPLWRSIDPREGLQLNGARKRQTTPLSIHLAKKSTPLAETDRAFEKYGSVIVRK